MIMVMSLNKQLRSGVFVDGSNVMWGSLMMKQNERWFIDFNKFMVWLNDNHNPVFVKYYGTVDTKPKTAKFKMRAQSEAQLYAKMGKMGYEIITKPLKYIKHKNGKFTTKGDMDIEIALGVIKQLDNLDSIVLVSGDSDYLALMQLIHSQGKSVHIISFRKLLSWELRTFAEENNNCDYRVLESIRKDIEYIKS